VIVPPAAIGVLGGGQLGRYTVVAARLSGYRTVVLDPDPAAPAGRVADEHLVAPYDDPGALDHLAATCAVVTTEFENPPAEALERLSAEVVVAPSARAVAIAQDRRAEKQFLTDLGMPTAPFTVVETEARFDGVAFPAILKTARMGYDGKGQWAVAGGAAATSRWDDVGGVPCVLEQRVPLDAELSVLLARTVDGRRAVFPVAENHHVDGILDLTVVPARVGDSLAAAAVELATTIADALEYVGVLAVELFVSDGRLLVNELAPRPHNSGHWTLDGAAASQFDQQVRAVCDAALARTVMTTPAAAMARLHLYGKTEPRPGRKMGHLTVLGATPDAAAAHALDLRARLRR
jgi:5-(carboxyamino)imidazole ribonucleotide synthase